jgi:hypothetical protein
MTADCKAWISLPREEVLSVVMLIRRILYSTAACLLASAVLADEPECATNYKSGATSAETSVLTVLAPAAVIDALPFKLAAAGAAMEWSNPSKGIIKAGSLDVKAEASGKVTRVTFHSSPAVDKATLCRYATLVGNPPLPPAPPVAQDPALIAQLKNDLRLKHQIVQPEIGRGINNVTFRGLEDFLEFTVTGIKDLPEDKREYRVTMVLPRDLCLIAAEDLNDAAMGMVGQSAKARTKPGRADATMVYAKDGAGWKFLDAFITHLETVK